MTMRVLCLGDSIPYGERAFRGWPEIMWSLTGWHVINRAIPGRLLETLRAAGDMPLESWDWIVIQAGTVDAKGGGVPPADFAEILEQLVAVLEERFPGARVAVCEPPGIQRSGGSPQGFNRLARRWCVRVEPLIREVAERRGVTLVTLPTEADWFSDGVHLNRRGCLGVARAVSEALAESGGPVERPGN